MKDAESVGRGGGWRLGAGRVGFGLSVAAFAVAAALHLIVGWWPEITADWLAINILFSALLLFLTFLNLSVPRAKTEAPPIQQFGRGWGAIGAWIGWSVRRTPWQVWAIQATGMLLLLYALAVIAEALPQMSQLSAPAWRVMALRTYTAVVMFWGWTYMLRFAQNGLGWWLALRPGAEAPHE